MLLRLHVKNFALIEEEEINFGSGLNILSGETGAGKSIILGALELALGGKVAKGVLRDEQTEGLAEAVFTVTDAEKQVLRDMDISVYDDEVIMTRKITGDRSSAKINGETVPAARMREVGAYLLDIYGQQENQSLLNKKKHLELLDAFAYDAVKETKEKVQEAYRLYTEKKKEFDEANRDGSDRVRQLDFLEHEVAEIEEAHLKEGEDAALEETFKKLSNGQKIGDGVEEAYRLTGGMDAASDKIGRALKSLKAVEDYDEKIADLLLVLTDADDILSDFNRQLSEYKSDFDFSEETFRQTELRLNEINHLKSKYGSSVAEIFAAMEEKKKKIEKLKNYDAYLANLQTELQAAEEQLNTESQKLSVIRQQASVQLCARVKDVLLDLNFLDVKFDMAFSKTPEYTANGTDVAEFMISANTGEPVRPLVSVASGGELSRVMLALKTILAQSDAIDTLIFDEIDAGISGRTAQAVSEKIYLVSRVHQVILITHLPQIAAMADHHFLIEKGVVGQSTVSSISELFADQITGELARMVGGVEITGAAMENARELKELADAKKTQLVHG